MHGALFLMLLVDHARKGGTCCYGRRQNAALHAEHSLRLNWPGFVISELNNTFGNRLKCVTVYGGPAFSALAEKSPSLPEPIRRGRGPEGRTTAVGLVLPGETTGARQRLNCVCYLDRPQGADIVPVESSKLMARIAAFKMERPMDLQLTNKKALVSGSTAGIGFAIASLLAQEGASVVVNGR